jgi:hypothetical protein
MKGGGCLSEIDLHLSALSEGLFLSDKHMGPHFLKVRPHMLVWEKQLLLSITKDGVVPAFAGFAE